MTGQLLKILAELKEEAKTQKDPGIGFHPRSCPACCQCLDCRPVTERFALPVFKL